MLDFGRSALEDTGLRAFKGSWGTEERPIVYTTLVGSARHTRRAPSRAAAVILRRAPLWVCRGVGTALYRYAA